MAAWINAKTGKFAVALGSLATAAVVKAWEDRNKKQVGVAVSNEVQSGLQPKFTELSAAQKAEFADLRSQNELLKQTVHVLDANNQKANLGLAAMSFVLGLAAPLVLKYGFSIG